MTDRKIWAGTLIFFAAVIALCHYSTQATQLLELQAKLPTVVLAIVALHAWFISSKSFRNNLSAEHLGILILMTAGFLQAFVWSLVVSTNELSGPMLASLPILVTAYHSEFLLLSKKHLWGLLPAVCAITFALLMSPTSTHTTAILIASIFAIAASFIMGSNAVVHSQIMQQRDDLKEALEATTLMDSVNETEKAKDLLYELMGANHDAGNAITSVVMNLELLTSVIESPEDHDNEMINELSSETQASLGDLMKIIEKSRSVGKEVHDGELVNASKLLPALIDKLSSTHSDKRISFIFDINDSVFIKLHGGETTLQRVLTNIVKNACEGNGTLAATVIDVTARIRDNNLELMVADNGPGFNDAFLTRHSSTYQTTKEHGSGLGLHTCKRLIMANKGRLDLTNQSAGGALVSICLPLSS